MRSRQEQIEAILSWNTFVWAREQLPPGKSMDDFRFRDFISVTEDDVYDFVLSNGFSPRVVAERDETRRADNKLCIAPLEDGRWIVYYTERGQRSEEVKVPSQAAARHEVVRRLMDNARINLNHRYRSAHPEMDLPGPREMD